MTQEEVKGFIEEKIKTNTIVVFMKGTPEFPMCGFSGRVVGIFQELGKKVEGINVLEDENLREGIKDYTQWPTLPQVFVKGQFIGGCDITSEMFESGELQKMLQDI